MAYVGTQAGRITLDPEDPANAAAFAQDTWYRGGPGVGQSTWTGYDGQPILSQLPRDYNIGPARMSAQEWLDERPGAHFRRDENTSDSGTAPAGDSPGSIHGIDVGPVVSPEAMEYNANQLRIQQAPVPASVVGNTALEQHLKDLMGTATQRAATDFQTQGAYNNAQQTFRSQQAADQAARGQYGVDASDYLSRLGDQDNVFRTILSALGGLTPSLSSPGGY